MTAQDPAPRPALKPWYSILLWLVIAAVAGGAVTSLVFTGVMWVVDNPGMTMGFRALLALGIAFAIATPLCLGGLLIFGGPVWLLLRLLRKDSLTVCILAGGAASLAFGLVYLAVNNGPALDFTPTGLAILPIFTLPGAVCGWIMRRHAYRPAPRP